MVCAEARSIALEIYIVLPMFYCVFTTGGPFYESRMRVRKFWLIKYSTNLRQTMKHLKKLPIYLRLLLITSV
jgi:hypothetical protein